MADFVVRKGEASDIPSMFRLLRELDTAETLVDVIPLSEEGLNRDFQQGCFRAIVAERSPSSGARDDVDVIGCILYSPSYSYFTGTALLLHGFYVRSDSAGKYTSSGIFRKSLKTYLSMQVLKV
ncbi:spermidine/spermine N(1)-acetyltransferase-like protein 1 [Diadema antillarum]|uniref:spermidine/spermine N(1)-acetyltransferase-like protein 1 n=1 Tax=Diadema antillarum TaxID=105358 RepID=UPI003A8BFB1B